jgi:ArsR family transcriptional regulator, arsenate/arsenite/antimonite-responsive transcriptional repressor
MGSPMATTGPDTARTRGCCVSLAMPMPPGQADALAGVFRALADPTRVQMLRMLQDAGGPLCVCDLTAAFEQSQPTISHHLAKLRDAGFVHSEKHGIWAFYSLREDMPEPCRQALALLA